MSMPKIGKGDRVEFTCGDLYGHRGTVREVTVRDRKTFYSIELEDGQMAVHQGRYGLSRLGGPSVVLRFSEVLPGHVWITRQGTEYIVEDVETSSESPELIPLAGPDDDGVLDAAPRFRPTVTIRGVSEDGKEFSFVGDADSELRFVADPATGQPKRVPLLRFTLRPPSTLALAIRLRVEHGPHQGKAGWLLHGTLEQDGVVFLVLDDGTEIEVDPADVSLVRGGG